MNWPIELQAPSCKHLELDRSLNLGYSRIKKNETRTYAQLNASRPRTVVTRRNNCSRNCSALEATDPGLFYLPKDSIIKQQAFQPEAQASSSKPQATSSEILEPRYMDIGEVLEEQGPRVFAKIKVLCGCLIWKPI